MFGPLGSFSGFALPGKMVKFGPPNSPAADRSAKPATVFFSRFGPFGVDLQIFFSGKIFIQKYLEKFQDLSREH